MLQVKSQHQQSGDAMKVKDPVCGMTVETETAKYRHTHDGVAYFFCNPK